MLSLRNVSSDFVCASRFQNMLRTMATEVADMANIVEDKDLGVQIIDVEHNLRRTYSYQIFALPLASAKRTPDLLTDAAAILLDIIPLALLKHTSLFSR